MNRAAAVLLLCALPSVAQAGPWTREPGHAFVAVNYAHIASTSLYGPDFKTVPILPYEQHVVTAYAELGVVARWLTLSLDGTLFRDARLSGLGSTWGVGDWRVGFWSGLVERPVRFTVATLVGVPLGAPPPPPNAAGDGATLGVERRLPRGDGEVDVEWRASFGTSFGGVRRWPLQHYLVVEAGYWLLSGGFADAVTYRVELGLRLPWRFVERFWLTGRMTGIESFASDAASSRSPTGLGNGVTYVSPGVELFGRLWRGLGASVGADSAFRARSVPAAAQLKVGLSYQY